MNSIELVSTLFIPISLLYIFIFIVLYGHKYLKSYERNRILIFTQTELKEKMKEIHYITQKTHFNKQHFSYSNDFDQHDHAIDEVLYIMSLYNELAVGIHENLYNENYIKMVIGYDMMKFYQEFYPNVLKSYDIYTAKFFHLELLLNSWYNDTDKRYYHE
jgi:hypothetical protein|nr:MAG TPA: protein of unknown function DUF4760 [Caudoviricetes sp.]